MEDRKKTGVDPDDFWNLAALLPQRSRKGTYFSRESGNRREGIAPKEIAVSRPDTHPAITPPPVTDVPLSEHFVPPHTATELQERPKPQECYRPQGSLVEEVRIYPWKNEYFYYEQFCRHARQLFNKEGDACPEVDFFSYMPQYTQLNRQQLAYYLWWRSNFRNGVCLPAAYPYLLLYLYELINLDDLLDPSTGQELMLRLWLSYRDQHPRLDVLVREWLWDHSLVHHLPPPALPFPILRWAACSRRARPKPQASSPAT